MGTSCSFRILPCSSPSSSQAYWPESPAPSSFCRSSRLILLSNESGWHLFSSRTPSANMRPPKRLDACRSRPGLSDQKEVECGVRKAPIIPSMNRRLLGLLWVISVVGFATLPVRAQLFEHLRAISSVRYPVDDPAVTLT